MQDDWDVPATSGNYRIEGKAPAFRHGDISENWKTLGVMLLANL
jgi:hypothetical protein